MLLGDLGIQYPGRLQVIVPRALQKVMGVAGFVGDGARHFPRGVAAEVGILSVFKMTIVFSLVIENVHLAALIEP